MFEQCMEVTTFSDMVRRIEDPFCVRYSSYEKIYHSVYGKELE